MRQVGRRVVGPRQDGQVRPRTAAAVAVDQVQPVVGVAVVAASRARYQRVGERQLATGAGDHL